MSVTGFKSQHRQLKEAAGKLSEQTFKLAVDGKHTVTFEVGITAEESLVETQQSQVKF